MSKRTSIRDILAARNIQLHSFQDNTTLANVGEKAASLMGEVNLLAHLFPVIRDFGANLGIKSTTEQTADFDYSYEKVVAATVLAINQQRLDLQQMLDIEKGGYFEIAIPASMTSGEGKIIFIVEEMDQSLVSVTGKAEVPGQKFAWGRLKAMLTNVFDQIPNYLKILPD